MVVKGLHDILNWAYNEFIFAFSIWIYNKIKFAPLSSNFLQLVFNLFFTTCSCRYFLNRLSLFCDSVRQELSQAYMFIWLERLLKFIEYLFPMFIFQMFVSNCCNNWHKNYDWFYALLMGLKNSIFTCFLSQTTSVDL